MKSLFVSSPATRNSRSIGLPSRLSLLLLVVGTLCVLLPFPVANAFGVPPKGSLSALLSETASSTRRTRSSLRYQNEESSTSTSTSTSTTPTTPTPTTVTKNGLDLEDKDEVVWELREDWALQDAVPRYTVGTNHHPNHKNNNAAAAVTFWKQLRHSTQELSARTEDELEERYREWYASAEDSLLVECGGSPSLLSDWSLSGDGVVSGSLPNGSRIWFPLNSAGIVGCDDETNYCGDYGAGAITTTSSSSSSSSKGITQDTLDDCFISASMAPYTSSYAESMAGVVYELGAPRCEAHRVYNGARTPTTTAPETNYRNGGSSEDEPGITHHLVTGFAKTHTGTLSAMIASSAVSVCLALGCASSQIQTASGALVQNHNSFVGATTGASSTTGPSSTTPTELTVSEQRARAELRVGRDQRSLVMMQNRLEKDELLLKELRQEESRLEAAEFGF